MSEPSTPAPTTGAISAAISQSLSEQTVPPPVHDINAAVEQLREHGVTILLDALDPDTLEHARSALYRAAESDLRRGIVHDEFGLDQNDRNQRVWNLLSRDPVFIELSEHPHAIRLVEAVLGWPALLSNISGNIAYPGAVRGVLHADQVFVPEPWPAEPQGINTAWFLDDVTAENGGTEIAPGSIQLHRSYRETDGDVTTVAIEAPAGSLVAFESRLWHRAGANVTESSSRGIVFPFYSRTVYRPQENWFLSLDPGVLQNASDTLLTLLAYKTEGFGLVYGRSPR